MAKRFQSKRTGWCWRHSTSLRIPIPNIRFRTGNFVLYTDGLLEASDATGNSFGQARLRAKAGQGSGLAPSDGADTLLSAARNWSTSQMDDLTLIVCDCSL
jgi:hypothetical protein